jgi:uncharacterized protein (TIGR01777 family)
VSERGRKLGVAITGASGLVGSRLAAGLKEAGHAVYSLKRAGGGGVNAWDVATGEIRTAGPVDVVVNLAGRNIATRWTRGARKEIWESRVTATEKLAGFLARMPERPRLLISASATGIYGDRGDEVLSEDSPVAPQGASYLSDICRAWEAATKPAEEAGMRVIHLRLGVVLSKEGGALAKMLTPTKLGLGGPVGRGTQWMPWISPADLQALLMRLVEGREERGPMNAVAGSVRQHEFMRTLGKVVGRPTVFPMPGFVVKLLFGQMGREVLLGSQRVEAKRLPEGFGLEHPTLEGALRAQLGGQA